MEFHIRDATNRDSLDLLSWRNDHEVRKFSREQGLLSEETHAFWLIDRLRRIPKEPFWVFEDQFGKIGFVRFDFDKVHKHFEISIIVNPLRRGEGLGKEMLKQATSKCLRDHPLITLYAETHKDNQASVSLFLMSNFIKVGFQDNFLFFKRS